MTNAPDFTPLPRARYLAHRQAIDAALAEVFVRGQFILGPETRAFESEFAAFLGATDCIGVANGTDALEIALRSCGIGPGDAVVTVSLTATATVAAIERAGATPLFADIDEATFTLDPESLRAIIQLQQKAGSPRIKAVIPVHLYGQAADLPAILSIAREHGLRVIEDCAQAHGATLSGRPVGTWGDLAAFSFYPTKNLGAFGDAGALVTSDPALADRARALREYGWKTRYVSAFPGVNSRIDEIHAATLRVLLKALTEENVARQRLARRYDEALADSRELPPVIRKDATHVFHQYVIRSPERDSLQSFLTEAGVPTQIHYPVPVHLQPAYAGRFPINGNALRRTESAAREILSLPMSPHFDDVLMQRVLNQLGRWKTSRSNARG